VVYAGDWWLFLRKPLSLEVLFLEAIAYHLIRAVVSKAVGVQTEENFVPCRT